MLEHKLMKKVRHFRIRTWIWKVSQTSDLSVSWASIRLDFLTAYLKFFHLFNFIYQDGNGFINRQELAVVMKNLGEQMTPEEIQVKEWMKF